MKRWHHKKKTYVDVWPAIKREGLKPMGRNHIHFVPHEAREWWGMALEVESRRSSHCQVGSRTVISGMRQGIGATVAWSISWPFVACLRYSQPENRMPPFFWSTKECFLSFEIYREYYIMNITCTMIMYDVVIQSFIAFRFSWLCS